MAIEIQLVSLLELLRGPTSCVSNEQPNYDGGVNARRGDSYQDENTLFIPFHVDIFIWSCSNPAACAPQIRKPNIPN